ncbi:MAG: fluoride efflux transporter CrcB [Chitinophagales bacterium]
MKYLYVIIGGAIGSLLRFVLAEFITGKSNSAFPYATFSVNLIGSLLIGFLFGLFSVNGQLDDKVRFLLFVGFLGGFTTFSSFALENLKLMQASQISTALIYIFASNILGIALAFAGYFISIKLK